VSLREDHCQLRKDVTPRVLEVLNSFLLGLLDGHYACTFGKGRSRKEDIILLSLWGSSAESDDRSA
jgi:hypothetical protein